MRRAASSRLEDLPAASHERVVPCVHRRGPRVPGRAVDDHLAPRVADDAGDDSERDIGEGEPRALLDVHLQEGAGKLAELGAGSAADAADLLAPEGDDGAATDPVDRLDRHDHAQRTVELPAPRDAVEVGAGPDGGACPWDMAEEVPCRVDLDVEAGLLQPAAGELVRRVFLGRAEDAVCARPAADRIQLGEAIEDAVDAHRANASAAGERCGRPHPKTRGTPMARDSCPNDHQPMHERAREEVTMNAKRYDVTSTYCGTVHADRGAAYGALMRLDPMRSLSNRLSALGIGDRAIWAESSQALGLEASDGRA